MGASSIGQLVLYLNRKALDEGRVTEEDPTAVQLLDTIRRGDWSRYACLGGKQPQGVVAGMELRTGRAICPEACKVREAALIRLADYDTFLLAVDAIGYKPQVVKAALEHHYARLCAAEVGSDGNCVLLDLECAIRRLREYGWKAVARRSLDDPSLDVGEVVGLLASGLGAQEIGARLKTNGSRLVGRVVKALSVVLEGGTYDDLCNTAATALA